MKSRTSSSQSPFYLPIYLLLELKGVDLSSCKHDLSIKSQQILMTTLRSRMCLDLVKVRETECTLLRGAEPVETGAETADEGLPMLQKDR